MDPKPSEAQTIKKKDSRTTTVILDVYEVGSNRKIHLPIGETCDQEIQEKYTANIISVIESVIEFLWKNL